MNSFTAGFLAAFALASSAAVAHEPKANSLFGKVMVGVTGDPSPIGSYTKGCIAGAIQLPETGPTWQAMRLSRNRNWGHPVLIDFIGDLGERAAKAGWKGLYVGDLSQPRGGPMTSGHASHQIGLDADIWMLPPKRLNLSSSEREEISSISVRTADQSSVNENWTDTHMQIMKAAAMDPRVDRIFVAGAVKVEMCRKAGKDRMWLQKIRPWYGHNTHFHVRLKCPAEAKNCITQTPTVSQLSNGGDGCDASLDWWVVDYVKFLKKPRPEPKKPVKPKRGVRDYVMADLPPQCRTVLHSN